MAPSDSPWNWDIHRKKYYRVQTGWYIYEDGEQIQIEGFRNDSVPTTSQIGSSSKSPGYDLGNSSESPRYGLGSSSKSHGHEPDECYGMTLDDEAASELAFKPYGVYEESRSTNPDDTQLHHALGAVSLNNVSSFDEENADLARVAGRHIESAPIAQPKYSKKLFPGYTKESKKYFTPGTIFRMIWNSPERSPSPVSHAIRWFVVVIQADSYCLCLPIQTYQGRGVGKPGVVKCQHSIICSNRTEPSPAKEEQPEPGEAPMLPCIQARIDNKAVKLDLMARIRYSKIFNIEYGSLISRVGAVKEAFLDLLKDNFFTALSRLQSTSESPREEEVNVNKTGYGDSGSYGFQMLSTEYNPGMTATQLKEQPINYYESSTHFLSSQQESNLLSATQAPGTTNHASHGKQLNTRWTAEDQAAEEEKKQNHIDWEFGWLLVKSKEGKYQTLRALIDSGADACFISRSLMRKLGWRAETCTIKEMTMADNSKVFVNEFCPLQWYPENYTGSKGYKSRFFVMESPSHELILSKDDSFNSKLLIRNDKLGPIGFSTLNSGASKDAALRRQQAEKEAAAKAERKRQEELAKLRNPSN